MIELELDLGAAGLGQPSIGPLFEVDLETESSRGGIQLCDEIFELSVLERVLREVSLETLFEDIFAKEEYHLMQKGGTLSIADSIKDILRNTRILDITGDGMRRVLLILRKTPVLLVEEDVPCECHILETLALIHCHV